MTYMHGHNTQWRATNLFANARIAPWSYVMYSSYTLWNNGIYNQT